MSSQYATIVPSATTSRPIPVLAIATFRAFTPFTDTDADRPTALIAPLYRPRALVAIFVFTAISFVCAIAIFSTTIRLAVVACRAASDIIRTPIAIAIAPCTFACSFSRFSLSTPSMVIAPCATAKPPAIPSPIFKKASAFCCGSRPSISFSRVFILDDVFCISVASFLNASLPTSTPSILFLSISNFSFRPPKVFCALADFMTTSTTALLAIFYQFKNLHLWTVYVDT